MYPAVVSDTKRFSHNTDERLINAVFKREPLWNSSNELHKNSVILKRLWNDISYELNKDVISIKTRWKNLRAYFIKVHKKSDGPELSTITWQFYDQLAFLKSCTPGLDKDSHIKIEDDDDDSSSSVDETAVDVTDKANSDSDSNSALSNILKRKRAKLSTCKAQINETENTKTDIFEDIDERNDDLHFFKSLLPYVQIIPLMRKLKLRCKIQEMILKELEAVENEAPQQQTRFTEVFVDNPQSSSTAIKTEQIY